MNTDAIERALRGAASTPLTKEQKQKLAMVARRAWEMQGFCWLCPDTETLDDWRHRQTLIAVERRGLRSCTNEDYLPLMAHFWDMQAEACERVEKFGGKKEAERLHNRAQGLRIRAAVEPRSWALARLNKECAAAGDVIERPRAYAGSIAHSKFKKARFDELTDRQIWVLIFDLRRAAAARRKKGGAR